VCEGTPLRILLVDDTPGAEGYVSRWLGADLPLAEVRQVPDAAGLSEALASDRYDVVITEAHLPWTAGLDVLRAVKERQPEHPVVMLTSRGNEDLAVSALQAGFDAYLRKGPDQGGRLAAAISAALETARERAARRRAEAALIESEARARAALAEWRREATEKSLILENMLDAVIVTDREGRYVLVNASAGRLLGMDPSELLGVGLNEQPWQTFDEAGEPIRYEERPLVRALRGERASMVQRIRTVDGREVVARAASAPVRDESGAIVGAVHVVHDVTEDHARARQAAQGARLRSLGQLAGGVAHDLNQYLGLVVGYGDLAMQALAQDEPDIDGARDSLATMIRAAVDGAEAVRRLLLFARPSVEGPATRVDLDDVLREVAKLTAPRWRDAAQQQGRPISVVLEIEGDVAIDGWASDLREAFANLVLNAVDALPRGGLIRLAARARGREVVAEVADDGVGISAETRERLFEPFFSTKDDGGSGLGLAIVFGIVERHGGTIEVDSAPGRGTLFRLAFPAAAQPAAPDAGSPAADVARRLRIVVVDDELTLVTMLARLLASDGHDVTVATSAEEALAILAGSSADVVISDLSMGAGMNGWELADAVHALPTRPYFILTTGWGAEIDQDEAAGRGVRAVIAKPYRLPDLRQVLNTL
jgi:PAS domain S-box-containing protein